MRRRRPAPRGPLHHRVGDVDQIVRSCPRGLSLHGFGRWRSRRRRRADGRRWSAAREGCRRSRGVVPWFGAGTGRSSPISGSVQRPVGVGGFFDVEADLGLPPRVLDALGVLFSFLVEMAVTSLLIEVRGSRRSLIASTISRTLATSCSTRSFTLLMMSMAPLRFGTSSLGAKKKKKEFDQARDAVSPTPRQEVGDVPYHLNARVLDLRFRRRRGPPW